MIRRNAALAAAAFLMCLTVVHSASAAAPRVNYMLHCQGCHLADGAATPGIIPPLAGAARFLSAEGGREYLIRVPGVALSSIDDAQLAALMNWVLEQFSPGQVPPDFVAYSAAEVARYRQRPLVDVDDVRREVIGEAWYDRQR